MQCITRHTTSTITTSSEKTWEKNKRMRGQQKGWQNQRKQGQISRKNKQTKREKSYSTLVHKRWSSMASQHIKLMSQDKTKNMLNTNIKIEWKGGTDFLSIKSCAIGPEVCLLLWQMCNRFLWFWILLVYSTQAVWGTTGSEVMWSLIHAVEESGKRCVTPLITQTAHLFIYVYMWPYIWKEPIIYSWWWLKYAYK